MKPNKRKLLSLICCLLLILCLLPIQAPKVKAINNVWIEVMSRRVGMKATYKFHFSLEKTLAVHHYIKLIFPKEVTFPPKDPNPPPPKDPGEVPPPRDPTQPPGGSDPGQDLPIIDYAENSLKFNSHIELDPSKEGYKEQSLFQMWLEYAIQPNLDFISVKFLPKQNQPPWRVLPMKLWRVKSVYHKVCQRFE
jgi:hypothetical protein